MRRIIIILLFILLTINKDEFYVNPILIKDTDDILIMVNKNNYLDKNYSPYDLEMVDIRFANKDKYLRKEAKLYYELMASEASKKKYNINLVSAFRDYNYQDSLFKDYVLNYGLDYALLCSAKAGHSEHQTGLAIDIEGSNNDYNSFEESKEFKWMKLNSYKYGFILRYPKGKEEITGYKYEPWHYRYVGINTAKYLYRHNLVLEEYEKE